VLALPLLLKQLKDSGYHIVQAVPTGDRPPSVPKLVHENAAEHGWPRIPTVQNETMAPGKPRKHIAHE
jgi:hypothetical protein